MAKHILIVEDPASIRRTITQSLRRAGLATADFEEASDDIEGMEAFESRTFDLIVSDVVDEAMGNGAKDCLKQPFTPEKPEFIEPFLK